MQMSKRDSNSSFIHSANVLSTYLVPGTVLSDPERNEVYTTCHGLFVSPKVRIWKPHSAT